ncbi:MAG: cytochrome c oxidase assembly protein [Caulobacterales bacterium]
MTKTTNKMRLTALLAAAAVAAMVGLSFAAVPLYDMFCKVTGYGGTTQTATAAPSRVLERSIEVHFDTNVAQGLPIRFVPREANQTLRIGQTGLAFFEVENTSDHPVTAVATFNVAPHATGVFFQKLQCFCFQDRVFQPGEKATLPVLYFIDPAIVDERETRDISQITLSYTYFPTPDQGGS